MRRLLTDRYDRRARLIPAVLAAGPALILAGIAAPATVGIWAIALPFAALCLPFLFAQIIRHWGLRVQDDLFAYWGGRPSERLLRWRSSEPRTLVARRHLLVRTILDINLPDEVAEAADHSEADAAYAAATAALRERTRDQDRFPLVFAENVAYGFWRNAHASRLPATVVSVLSAAATLWLAGLSAIPLGWKQQAGLVSIDLLAAIVWWLCFTRAAVRRSAEKYAEQLFASLETLGSNQGCPPVHDSKDYVSSDENNREQSADGFPGGAKIHVLRRLQADWRDLAEIVDVPIFEQRRFRVGDEPRALWEWLEDRGRISELPDALEAIDRADLAEILNRHRK